MKIYLAGNFPQLTKRESEQVMVDNIVKAGSDYNRLITYFFPKYCKTVIDIIRDEPKGENK
jgi:hypothetical protein